MLVFHAKHSGDLHGVRFQGSEVFFADKPRVASTYAEHRWMCKNYEADYDGKKGYAQLVLSGAIVVFPCLLTLEKPVVLDRRTLKRIGRDVGPKPATLSQADLSLFADKFEDSETDERKAVFDWARAQGFDGAVLPRDWMPKVVEGDWHFTKSFVAFQPERQLQFALLQ